MSRAPPGGCARAWWDICNHNTRICDECIVGADVTNAKLSDAGAILSDTLRKLMRDLKVQDGLTQLGYTKADIPTLVQGTLPQVCPVRLSHLMLITQSLRSNA